MDVLTAVNIGIDCGLSTVGEALLNIALHSTNWFSFGSIANEEKELQDDFENHNLQLDMDIHEAQKLLNPNAGSIFCFVIEEEIDIDGVLQSYDPPKIERVPWFDSWHDIADWIMSNADNVITQWDYTIYHFENNRYFTGRDDEYLILDGHRIDL
jgi:hypothetical protein